MSTLNATTQPFSSLCGSIPGEDFPCVPIFTYFVVFNDE